MAVIKSGATTDQLTVDPTSKAARVTAYDAAGVEKGTNANPLTVVWGLVESGRYVATSFRTVGLASANHNIFTIENPVASGKKVGIVRLTYQAEGTALSTALVVIRSGRTAGLPTGGQVLNIVRYDTTYGVPVAVCRGATASDGGAAAAIAATMEAFAWSQFRQRAVTLAGYFMTPDNPVLPIGTEDHPFVLREGQAFLVQLVTAALTTDHHQVNCAWIEYA